MILSPGVMALVLEAIGAAALGAYGALLGYRVLRHWRPGGIKAVDLALEKRMILGSLLLRGIVAIHVAGLFLFLFVLDDLHNLFTGAMCATGTLNVAPIGWWALGLKLLSCVLCLGWLRLDQLDRFCPGLPAMEAKSWLMLILAPLLILEAWFTISFFSSLKPGLITSCCSVLFDSAAASGGAGTPAWSHRWAGAGAVAGLFVYLGVCSSVWWSSNRWLKAFVAPLALLFLGLGLWGVTWSFSPYFYGLPNHHCPFDILQRGYWFLGYPLYAALIFSVGYGVAIGGGSLVGRSRSCIQRYEKRWCMRAVTLAVAAAAAVGLWVVVSGLTFS